MLRLRHAMWSAGRTYCYNPISDKKPNNRKKTKKRCWRLALGIIVHHVVSSTVVRQIIACDLITKNN